MSAYIPNKLPSVNLAGFSINPNIAVQTFNASLEANLTGYDLLFMDNFEDVLDPLTQKAKTSLMRDNVHLNQAGRQIVASNFADAILTVVPEANALVLVGILAIASGTGIRRISASKKRGSFESAV